MRKNPFGAAEGATRGARRPQPKTPREGHPMRFAYWSREIAGWLVILAGLWLFWATYEKLSNKRLFEAAPMAFMGFVVFRGGVHLLKVAVAAQAARALPQSAAQPAKRPRPVARPVGPTPTKAVLPGPQNAPRRQKAAAGGPDDWE